eukprot:12303_1
MENKLSVNRKKDNTKDESTLTNNQYLRALGIDKSSNQYQKLFGSLQSKKSQQQQWNCSLCTYLNLPNVSNCEMCGNKNEIMIGDEWSCSACTFLNKSNI